MRKSKKRAAPKVRRFWKTKPATKIKQSDKLYRRNRAKQAFRKETSRLEQ